MSQCNSCTRGEYAEEGVDDGGRGENSNKKNTKPSLAMQSYAWCMIYYDPCKLSQKVEILRWDAISLVTSVHSRHGGRDARNPWVRQTTRSHDSSIRFRCFFLYALWTWRLQWSRSTGQLPKLSARFGGRRMWTMTSRSPCSKRPSTQLLVWLMPLPEFGVVCASVGYTICYMNVCGIYSKRDI